MSADGTVVAYDSSATDLVDGDTNTSTDIFVYDMVTGVTTRVSVRSDGTEGNSGSFNASVSADGTVVAYRSSATDLVDGDTNNTLDIFVYDVVSGVTTRISEAAVGGDSDGSSWYPSVSADGTVVAYESYATNLVDGDTNNSGDIFVHDMVSGVTTRISVDSGGGEGNGDSEYPSVSADGTVVAYYSRASGLVAGDGNAKVDVFVWTQDVTPTAAGLVASVGEDAAVGAVVGTVVGADSHGETVGFAITAGDGGGLFAIGAVSGVVTVAGGLDYETAVQHVLTVGVSDATHTVETSVTVDVTDVGGPLDVVVDPGADTFTDDDGSTFEADIEWMAAAGITLGCNPEGTLYCPNDTVTRAQMASFLVRALDLPAVAGNRFDDVSGTHLANINALAEAGVTLGCNPEGTLYCPDDTVSRAQMGSFLARALMLTPIPGDVFDDVSGTHEPNINAIADAAITLGCNPEGTLYCPDDPVTRGQMAAFLHRALG